MQDETRTLLHKKISEFGDISEINLNKLFSAAEKINISKGANILTEGKICNSVFFVESGYLRAFVVRDGIEINTDFIFENNFTTNLKSLRSATASDTTIQAGVNSVIYQLNKFTLLELYKESPEIESFGRKLLEQLLIAQEEHANLFKIFSPAERYRYLQSNKPEIIQQISLSQISSYLGIARETLSRIRKLK